jgi:hypothetical protein
VEVASSFPNQQKEAAEAMSKMYLKWQRKMGSM